MDSLDKARSQTARARNAEKALRDDGEMIDKLEKIKRPGEVPKPIPLSEIFQDEEKQFLFGKLLKERGGTAAVNKIWRKKIKQKELTRDELSFLAKESIEFTNRLKKAEKLEQMATGDVIEHLAAFNPDFRDFAVLLPPERAAELIKRQIRSFAMMNPDDLDAAIKGVEEIKKIKDKKEYKTTLAELERIKKRYVLSDEEVADVNSQLTAGDRKNAMHEIYKKRLTGFGKSIDTISGLRLQFSNRGIRIAHGETLSARKAGRAAAYLNWNMNAEVLQKIKEQEDIVSDALAIATVGDSEFMKAATEEAFLGNRATIQAQEGVSTLEQMAKHIEPLKGDKIPDIYRGIRERLSGELYNKTFYQLSDEERAAVRNAAIDQIESDYKVKGKGAVAQILNTALEHILGKIRKNPAHYFPNDPRPPKGKRNKNRNQNNQNRNNNNRQNNRR